MIAVSSNFKNAMKEPVKELSAYLKLDDNSTMTDNEDLISLKISCESSLGKSAMRKLEVKYIGNKDLLDKWVKAYIGVKVSNGEFEYIEYGSFLVTEMIYSADTETTTITGYDKMINSMVLYEPLEAVYPMSLYDYAVLLCNACGLTLENNHFIYMNNWQIRQDLWENIDNVTYRDIFEQIAQITCSTAMITADDKLCFKNITPTRETLTYDNLLQLKLEAKYGEVNSVILGRAPVVGEDVFIKDDQSIEENGLTEVRIDNNQIVDKNREDAIGTIYNAYHGINYYPFEANTEGLGYFEIGDSLDIENEEGDKYNVVLYEFSISVDGGIKETFKTAEQTKTQSQYQYASKISRRIANTEIIVDKQNQTIEAVVENVTEQNSKISRVVQTVDELEAKISDTADVTVSKETENASVSLDDINLSEPITIRIRPNQNSISYLYPRNNLYPSNDLFSTTRIIRFHNNTTGSDTNYELPDDLLYYSSTVYDEFYLDYDSKTCQIIKRCGYNADGTVKKLLSEETIDYPYPEGDKAILLEDGDYTISLLGYERAYLFVRLMTHNLYTSQFATRVELNTAITQTTNEINAEVSKKVNEDELISRINMTPGQILLEGTVTANNNFKILQDGSIEAKNGSFSGNIYLDDGGTVIGGNGILTNLQFVGQARNFNRSDSMDEPSGAYFLGFNGTDTVGPSGGIKYHKSYHSAQIHIPENFTVKEAHIIIIHDPISWVQDSKSGYGNVRQLKAYDITSESGGASIYSGGAYHFSSITFNSGNEIKNAFGANGKTFTNSGREVASSADISNVLSSSGDYTIAVTTAAATPSNSSGWVADSSKMGPYTGLVSMFVNVVGYMKTT